MGLVKTRRLAAMHKQTAIAKAMVVGQRAKAGLKSRKLRLAPPTISHHHLPPHFAKCGGRFREGVISYPA